MGMIGAEEGVLLLLLRVLDCSWQPLKRPTATHAGLAFSIIVPEPLHTTLDGCVLHHHTSSVNARRRYAMPHVFAH